MLNLKNLSREDVQNALHAYAAATSRADAIALLEKHGGVEMLGDLPESKFAAVVQAAHEVVAAVANKGKGRAQARPKSVNDLDAKAIYNRWNNPPAPTPREEG